MYTWRPVITEEMARRERLLGLATWVAGGLAVIAGVVLAALGEGGSTRFLVIVGAMLLTLGFWARTASRKARSAALSIDRNGLLSVAEGGSASTLDLRTVSSIEVRQRTGRPHWCWSIEAVSPAGGWHTELTPLASYVNLPADQIEALEVQLLRFLAWANPSVAPAAPHAAAPSPSHLAAGSVAATEGHTPATAAGAGPVALRGAVEASPDRLTWMVPRGDNAVRNRRRFRIGLAVTFLGFAIVAAVSVRDDGLDAMVLSMFAPLLYLLIGLGIDRAFMTGSKFKLIVDASGLTVDRGRTRTLTIPRADIKTIDVSTRSSGVTVDGTSTNANHWFLTVHRHSDQPGARPYGSMLPVGLGGSFTRNDAIALEAELRRRCGLSAR
ncbi:MAG: hypothetical protein R2710_13135 [Acidimicrobiales bacterium]